MIGMGSVLHLAKNQTDIRVTEIKGSAQSDFCSIKLPTSVSESSSDNNWMGPVVKMSLPSFSGRTEYNPELLKYSCQIECRMRPVEPAKVSGPICTAKNDISGDSPIEELAENDVYDGSISVLLSKPVFALEFNFLKMQVESPTLVVQQSKNAIGGS